jgi:hypothetical protein
MDTILIIIVKGCSGGTVCSELKNIYSWKFPYDILRGLREK